MRGDGMSYQKDGNCFCAVGEIVDVTGYGLLDLFPTHVIFYRGS